MKTLAEAPDAVRRYFALLGKPAAEQTAALPALFANDVNFSFAGTIYQGKDAVIARIISMPTRLNAEQLDWRIQPAATAQQITLRAAMPPGAPGGLVALEFSFELSDAGLITRIIPTPHHRTPDNLGEALHPARAPPILSCQIQRQTTSRSVKPALLPTS